MGSSVSVACAADGDDAGVDGFLDGFGFGLAQGAVGNGLVKSGLLVGRLGGIPFGLDFGEGGGDRGLVDIQLGRQGRGQFSLAGIPGCVPLGLGRVSGGAGGVQMVTHSGQRIGDGVFGEAELGGQRRSVESPAVVASAGPVMACCGVLSSGVEDAVTLGLGDQASSSPGPPVGGCPGCQPLPLLSPGPPPMPVAYWFADTVAVVVPLTTRP